MVEDKDILTVHYLTKAECAAKTAALKAKQEADPNYLIELTFLKDDFGWYADVPTHTRGQNAMVAGSDKLLDAVAFGKRKLVVGFRFVEDHNRNPLFSMRRITHGHGVGGTYLISGITAIPFPAWICDVCHDVTGEHPKRIFVYQIAKY